MARLNEPPVVGESVEALKRRFMRQNRELAKSNSTLNIRIANIEADRSQLLSDNITLREENNKLRQELERDANKRALQNVGSVKDKLAAKVMELNELMLQLNKAHTERPQPTTTPKPTRRRSFQRSPTHYRNWKASLYGPEITGLTPIVEGKYFPRRTLDADDLQNTIPELGNVAESPELAPPPVAHLDIGDPIKNDLSKEIGALSSPNGQKDKGDEDIPRDLGFANLETRRRRRGSSLIKESKGGDEESWLTPSEDANTNSTAHGQTLRAGAKRKISVRDDEKDVASKSQDANSFTFNRKTESRIRPNRDETTASKSVLQKDENKPPLDRRRDASVPKSSRKALEEKSINTDPVVSPVKVRTSGLLKSKDIVEGLAPKLKARERTRERANVEKRESSNIKSEEASLKPKDLPPITPAAPETNLFSPLDSMPSSTKPFPRDTPPPSELSQPTEGARPSRRQRTAVSYAEPSLRDKMRRPGKELVDAVTASNSKIAPPSTTRKPDTSITTKKENDPNDPAAETEWKKLPVSRPHDPIEPTSPLGAKSSTSNNGQPELPPTVITDRRRRSSAAPRNLDDGGPAPATVGSGVSQSTIAALVAGSQKRLSRAREAAEMQRRVSGEMSRGGEGWEIDGSSSPGPVEKKGGVDGREREKRGEKEVADGKGRLAGAGELGAGSRVSRRHSSMSEIRTGAGTGRSKEEGKEGLVRSVTAPSGVKLSYKKEEVGREEKSTSETLARAERAAARRRSMMV